jgi:Fic family protein
MEPFIPDHLPLDTSKWNWERLANKISSASASLAYYNGILQSMVNPTIFLSPLETKEAILSSHIEGTVTTLDEVLKFEADIKPESESKQQDIIEVLNYRKATRYAKDWLDRGLPFSLTFVNAIQKELISGVRGKDKGPGEIRKEQVWIGTKNSKIEEATYVPPEPFGLSSCLKSLFDFIESDEIETLIQTAILHAQFEIIHPYMDGNGRTGRILIPLFLWYKKRLTSPMFYISEYLDENRDEYVGNLLRISRENDWERWLHFFLNAIDVQAKRNADKAIQVLQLYSEMKKLVTKITNSPYGIKVLDTLFSMPIFRSTDFGKLAEINSQTTHRIIARFKQEKILTTIKEPAGRSPEILLFDSLYNLINS